MLSDRVNAGVRVGDVMRARQDAKILVEVSGNATISEVIETLVANNMVSAPVKDSENGTCQLVAKFCILCACVHVDRRRRRRLFD